MSYRMCLCAVDPGETTNLYIKHRDVAKTMAAKLKAIGNAAPPQASYWVDSSGARAAICKTEDATGWLEPLGWAPPCTRPSWHTAGCSGCS